MKRLSLILLFALASPAWADPYEDAKAADAKGDYATALSIVRPLAESGTAWAQLGMAIAYQKGHGVPFDVQEAVKWYRLAAAQGNGEAQLRLALHYYDDERDPQDAVEAVKWARTAVAKGNSIAQSVLGLMYYNGHGVPQDYVESAKWFMLSAAQGDSEAQLNLGIMYATGRGVLQDNVLAHMWFNLAAVRSFGSDDRAIKSRDLAASQMTPQQIGEAQKLARECQDRHFKGCSGSPPEVVQPTPIAPQRVATDSESKLGASLWWAIYGLGVLCWIPIQYLLMRKKFGETRFVDQSMWAMREEAGEYVRPWERFACVYLVPSLTVVSLALIFPLAMFLAARERISAQR